MPVVVYSRKRLRALDRTHRISSSNDVVNNKRLDTSKPLFTTAGNPPTQTSSSPQAKSTPPQPPSPGSADRHQSQVHTPPSKRTRPSARHSSAQSGRPKKRRRRQSLIQTHLDVGQADISSRRCEECGMVYAPGAQDDNRVHAVFHAQWRRNQNKRPRFPGWMGERVVGSVCTGRLVAVKACDVSTWTKRAIEIDQFISTTYLQVKYQDRLQFQTNSWLVILFVVDSTVNAFLLTEIVNGGRIATIATDGIASASRRRVDNRTLCGVRKIWVAQDWRRKGIASAMLDAARLNLLYGVALRSDDVAFTATTPAGSRFAAAYANNVNTKHIIVYSQSDVVLRHNRPLVKEDSEGDSKTKNEEQ